MQIVASDLPEISYEIFSGEKSFKHPAFTITSTGISDQSKCGGIAYTATYNGEPADSNANPFGYSAGVSESVISILSDDSELGGKEIGYAVTANWQNFPTECQSTIATSKVSYNNGCGSPTVIAPDQPTPPANKYTGTPVTATLNEFEVAPEECAISYECTGVTGPNGLDGLPITIDCNDPKLNIEVCEEANIEDCPDKPPVIEITCS